MEAEAWRTTCLGGARGIRTINCGHSSMALRCCAQSTAFHNFAHVSKAADLCVCKFPRIASGMVHAKRYIGTWVICSAADDDVEIWLGLHGIEKWLGPHLRNDCDSI